MKNNMYSVYDQKAGYYMAPFVTQNHDTAKRMIVNAIIDPNSSLSLCPEDYSLFMIGTFDDEHGIVSNENELVCNVVEMVQVAREKQKVFKQIDLFEENKDG